MDISFIIPTYNAASHIETCLRSIRTQKYLQDKVEILVLDGGSTDVTLTIASTYNCRILKNEKKLAEYGVQLGVREATGKFLVVFAADNELTGNDWIDKVVDTFNNDQDISAVWGKLVSGEGDHALNKYFELIQSDPLNWFLNKNLDKYKKEVFVDDKGFFKFNVNCRKPLVWGANGLAYRAEKIKKIWAQEGYLGDNDAFQYMIEQGDDKVAYFDGPFVYHHHVAKLGDWIKKWQRNFIQHLADKHQTRNMNWAFTDNFKIKLFFWVLYSLLFFIPLLQSIYLSLRDRNIYWLYHPVANSIQFTVYLFLVIFSKKGRNFIKGIIFNRTVKGV